MPVSFIRLRHHQPGFPRRVLPDLRRHYFTGGPSPGCGRDSGGPSGPALDDSPAGAGRGSRPRSGVSLRLDRFLLVLLRSLKGPVTTQMPMPEWLSEAITHWQRDQQAMEQEANGPTELAIGAATTSAEDQRDRRPPCRGSRERAADHGSRQGDAAPVRHPHRPYCRRSRPPQSQPLLPDVPKALRPHTPPKLSQPAPNHRSQPEIDRTAVRTQRDTRVRARRIDEPRGRRPVSRPWGFGRQAYPGPTCGMTTGRLSRVAR